MADRVNDDLLRHEEGRNRGRCPTCNHRKRRLSEDPDGTPSTQHHEFVFGNRRHKRHRGHSHRRRRNQDATLMTARLPSSQPESTPSAVVGSQGKFSDDLGETFADPFILHVSRSSIANSVSSEDVNSSSSSSSSFGNGENIDKFERLLCKEFNRDTLVSPVLRIPYKVLRKITDRFDSGGWPSHLSIAGGRKLGSGGTGTVFLGTFSDGRLVAVKRLDRNKVEEDLVTRQFVMEVEDVAKYRHSHILDILGYSVDGPYACIVYDYLPEGSVLDHLLKRHGKSFLTWPERLRIARETADAITYLHTSGPKPLVHRDIKSANVMLDEDLVAKLGDYGFAMFTEPSGSAGKRASMVVGTQAYMAPEAFFGDVSVKLDTFGFGVVLLELLTGMPAYDDRKAHPGQNLTEYVKQKIGTNYRRIMEVIDEEADWDPVAAKRLARIAFYCLRDKDKRPTMAKVQRAMKALAEFSLLHVPDGLGASSGHPMYFPLKSDA